MDEQPTADDLAKAYEELSSELDPDTINRIQEPQETWTVEDIQRAIESTEGVVVPIEESRMLALEQANEVRTLRAIGFRYAKRAQKIVDLTLQGYPAKEVASTLKMPERLVRDTLEKIFDRVRAPKVNMLREVMNHQLDKLMQVYLPIALLGDQKAAALALKIQERKSKLNRMENDVNIMSPNAPWARVYEAVLVPESAIEAEVLADDRDDSSSPS